MNRPEQLRILGLLALLAFGLHGAQVLSHDHGPGVDADCVICHGQQLTPLAVGPNHCDAWSPAPAGAVVEEAPPGARPTLLVAYASRGPPA